METRKKKLIMIFVIIFFFFMIGLLGQSTQQTSDGNISSVEDGVVVHIGLILDMSSMEGKILHSCVFIALSNFYRLNIDYRTRLVFHTRDSKGETLQALSAAHELLDKIKVKALIGGETRMEARLLAELGYKAKVPMLSLSETSNSSPRFNKNPFFIGIIQDEASQFKAVADMVEVFKWNDVVIIYEDTDFGSNVVLHMINSFQEKNIYVTHKTAVSSTWTDEQIVRELQKLMALQTTSFMVHLSRDLVSKVVVNAKKLGMMSEGYAWILTATTMNNLLHNSLDSTVVHSMQGVLGLKSYIPPSNELRNLTSRLRRKFYIENDTNMDVVDQLSVYAIRAYDSTWALAEAVERSSTHYGSMLVKEILLSKFRGLSGELEFTNGKLKSAEEFEIVNFIGKGERNVGFWKYLSNKINTSESEKGHIQRNLLSRDYFLEAIIWPGGTTTVPKGRSEIETTSFATKLRIGVPISRFTELVRVSYARSNVTFTGFCIKVFEAALSLLPYKLEYELIPFVFDQRNTTGSYEELIDQVYLKKYDGAVGDITITSNRSFYVDFTLPFTELGTAMVVRSESESNNIWIFLKPLSTDLWITTAAFFILTGFVVWLIERPTNKAFQGSPSQQIGTIFWFSFSTMVFAHREKLKSNLSKFVVIVWVFVVLILTSSYTATLTSMMTVQRIELVAKGNIGFYSNFVLNHKKVTDNLSFKELRSPEEYAEALSKGSERGGVSAIVDEIPYIKNFLARYPNGGYSMIKSVSDTNGFGFVSHDHGLAFRKGSHLAQDISRAIAQLRETGELTNMEKAWFESKSSLVSQESTPVANEPNAIDLMTFRGLFLICGISLITALFSFLISSLREKWHVVRKHFVLLGQKLRTACRNV
ncbi:Ionotropic glutamate receptor [Trema orientale]|uniref:Glutamate receptor n=1 Tax=Trema orientale TaxID=63057 RepID=A0A2P5CY28_TREOI|nr:Ionotropic glutamate receptor [Trema orientale]